jgi:hypothetical protein
MWYRKELKTGGMVWAHAAIKLSRDPCGATAAGRRQLSYRMEHGAVSANATASHATLQRKAGTEMNI